MRIVSLLLATILPLAPTPVWARTLGERRAAAWLSIAHPGLGEYYTNGYGFFFDNCPQKKFWLGFIPLYGWPGYLQVLSAIDAYHGSRSTEHAPCDLSPAHPSV